MMRESRTVTLTSNGGETVEFCIPRTKTRVYSKWMWHGRYMEELGLDYIRERVPPGGVYIDCGASFGNHTLYFAKCCRASQVFAFEPNRESFEYLVKNIKDNELSDVVQRYPWALSNETSLGSIEYNWRAQDFSEITEDDDEGHIPVVLVDNYFFVLDIPSRLDVLKIDCEGHSTRALRGAMETMKKHRPILFMEIKRDDWDEMSGLLTELDYRREMKVGRATYIFEPN